MEYVKVQWVHESTDEPVLYLSELGDDRYETRKVQIYHDGRMEWADETHEKATAGVSEIPFPELDEIAKQPEFVPTTISAEEFEVIWDQAHKVK